MGYRSRLLLLPCLTILACNSGANVTEPAIDVQDVKHLRGLFHVKDYDERVAKERQQLIEMGEKAFPAYEAILSDPESDSYEIGGVLGVLCEVKADRRRFLNHAVSRLTDIDSSVRHNAVILLKQIGSAGEASPVVALLSDKDKVVVHYAAKTLTAIGGSNEVVAMDVWLRGVSHRGDGDLRKHVQKCRDALKKRLDEARAKDPSK
ncbi:MAG TPA: hypothetical protein VH575_07565 [Gemmataceae bacterium]|jgi:HEAT repeat protein